MWILPLEIRNVLLLQLKPLLIGNVLLLTRAHQARISHVPVDLQGRREYKIRRQISWHSSIECQSENAMKWPTLRLYSVLSPAVEDQQVRINSWRINSHYGISYKSFSYLINTTYSAEGSPPPELIVCATLSTHYNSTGKYN